MVHTQLFTASLRCHVVQSLQPLSVSLLALVCLGSHALAQTRSPVARVERILASSSFKAAVAAIDRDHGRIVEEGIRLTEIPAPPFMDEARRRL